MLCSVIGRQAGQDEGLQGRGHTAAGKEEEGSPLQAAQDLQEALADDKAEQQVVEAGHSQAGAAGLQRVDLLGTA